MSTRSKPFAQYATVLSDGRTAVEVAVFDPFLVTVVLVASSKRDALDRVRSLGGRNVHVANALASHPLSDIAPRCDGARCPHRGAKRAGRPAGAQGGPTER
ncbi:hypothetical protein ACLBWP_04985 [Microbacterium sp. M1A1_1b]